MVECRGCKYATQDDISSTKSEFRKGNDIRYYCELYGKMVYEDDTCKNGEE